MKDYAKILNAPLTKKQEQACILASKMTQEKAAKQMGIKIRGFKYLLSRATEAYETYHGLDAETGLSKGLPAYNRSTLIKLQDDPEGRALIWKQEKGDPAAFARHLIDSIEDIVNSDFDLPRIDVPTNMADELANVIIITDTHIGMLAWSDEGGRDWVLKIAKRTIHSAVDDLLARSPRARRCIILFLGDLMHYDGLQAVTPLHGNLLDADSRPFQMIDVSFDVIYWTVLRALEYHNVVDLLVAEGNHDLFGSAIFQKSFKMLFSANPRVRVVHSPLPYYCFTHGSTMVACHHGHLKNKENFGSAVPAIFPREWGNSEYRYAFQGHVHSSNKKEGNGIITETFPTLAARDSYASRHAFFAQSGAACVTYSLDHGEDGRILTRPISALEKA